MAEYVLFGVLYNLMALIMIGIGVSQLESTEPTGFYTGETPPKPEEVVEVAA